MVGPISEGERASFRRKVKIGVALLVGVSAGLVAIQIDATLLQLGGAVAGGLVLGAVLAWYIVPSQAPLAQRRSAPDRDNPFADGGQNGDQSEDGNTDRGSDRSRRR